MNSKTNTFTQDSSLVRHLCKRNSVRALYTSSPYPVHMQCIYVQCVHPTMQRNLKTSTKLIFQISNHVTMWEKSFLSKYFHVCLHCWMYALYTYCICTRYGHEAHISLKKELCKKRTQCPRNFHTSLLHKSATFRKMTSADVLYTFNNR